MKWLRRYLEEKGADARKFAKVVRSLDECAPENAKGGPEPPLRATRCLNSQLLAYSSAALLSNS